MALTDFSGAFAPPNKLKPKSLFAFEPPSFDDSSDLENTHTTGESPTNAAYLPPGSRPTSNPTGVIGPSLGQQTRPDLVKDIYTPRLNEVTDKLESAYAPPQVGGFRKVLGTILSRKHPEIGGLLTGESQREERIKPLQQEYGLLSNAIGAQQKTQLADLNAQNVQSEIGHRANQDALGNRLANVKEDPQSKDPTNEVGLFLKDPAKAEAFMSMKEGHQKEKTPNEKEQAIDDYLQGHKLPNTPAMRDKARSVLATRDRAPKDPELADLNKQLKEAALDKALHPKPTVAEQNRADLADNLNENLDVLEDIVKRRPELFGWKNGRVTELKMMAGSDDPDIGKLKNVKHQGGMAQISSHGMRSAQGIEGAANALMDFHNGPNGILGAIASARSSVKVFRDQADEARNPGQATAKPASTGGTIRARDQNGKLHEAPAGTAIPANWTKE